MMKSIADAGKAAADAGHAIPPYKREGLIKLLPVLPWSKCVDRDGKCHCCCHPFEPIVKEDGTIECQAKNACKGPWMRAPTPTF